MKSSDRLIESGFLSNGPLYSLLAVFMPLTVLTALVFLLKTMLSANLPSAFLIGCGGASGLAASFYCDFMKDAKSGRTAANIRGGIIIVCVLYICASLFRREIPWKEKFQPDFINVMSSVVSLYVWISVVSLKRLFSARRHFETYVELYRGKQLQSALFEDSALLQYTEENINKARRNYFYQLAIIAVLVLSCSIYEIHLSLALYFLMITILAGAVCLFGFFEIIKWEHYYAAEGIGMSANDRAKRITAVILLTLLCITAAILPASNKSFIPPSLITRFFLWLFSLFRRSSLQFEETANAETPAGVDFDQDFSFFDTAAPSPLWEIISKYVRIVLKYGIIALAAAGFIRFMISPLLNRGEYPKETTFLRRLHRITTEWFKGVLNSFASFFANLKSGNAARKLRKYSAGEIHRATENLFGAYSQAKKKDMKRSVTLFARLILWGGETRHAAWKPSLAPGEYCEILAFAAPLAAPSAAPAETAPDRKSALRRLNEGIIRCGEIFEKALYSAEILCDREREEFKELVEEITSSDA